MFQGTIHGPMIAKIDLMYAPPSRLGNPIELKKGLRVIFQVLQHCV
jgi:hypothetical protein